MSENRNIVVNGKQLMGGLVSLIAVIVSLTLAIWKHEISQEARINSNYHNIEANEKDIKTLQQNWNKDMKEIKEILMQTNKTQTEIRDGLIRLEEKVKK